MSVQVDICNSGLIRVGADLISDLSDNTKEARLCNHQYERCLKAVLRSAPWSFAMKRASLTEAVVTLEFGEEAVFALPADCVLVVKLGEEHLSSHSYKIEGRYLLSLDFEDTCDIYYVSSGATPADYDYVFMEAVSCTLAAAIAYSLTQSAALKESLLAEAQFWINQARSYNSQEKTPTNFTFDYFLDSRSSGA
jgi:hypothetical protein